MAQAQARTEVPHPRFDEASKARTEATEELPVLPAIPAELVELGKKRVEALMEIQKELFDTLQEINLAWFERARSMASLNSELVAKLSAARTVRNGGCLSGTYGKRMEQFVEDSRQPGRQPEDREFGCEFLTNGSAGNGSAA